MTTLQEVTSEIYKEAAINPEIGLCCTSSPAWKLPDLIIPKQMLEMNYGCGSTVAARDLINKVLLIPNLDKFVITTPCVEFNKHYFDNDGEMRHDDHDFEMTRDEFRGFVMEIVGDHDYEFINLGDEVDGVPVSQGVCITVKKEVLA